MKQKLLSERDVDRVIGEYNLDHSGEEINYRFVAKKDHSKALHLGLVGEKFTIQGHRPNTAPVSLPLDFSLAYEGDIVIEGDLKGGKEIKSGGNIIVRGNIDGDMMPKTPKDFKEIAERNEPHRLTISAPKGKLIIKSSSGPRQLVQKTNVEARQVCVDNYDLHNVGITATSGDAESVKVATPKNTRHGNPQFHYVDVKSSGSVLLPDCYDCRIIAENAALTGADTKTRQQAQIAGEFNAGAEIKTFGERVRDTIKSTPRSLGEHAKRIAQEWADNKARHTLEM